MINLFRLCSSVLLIALLALWAPLSVCAQGMSSVKQAISEEKKPWEISTKRLSYDREAEVYVAEGDVVITKDDVTLQAQRAVYDQELIIMKFLKWQKITEINLLGGCQIDFCNDDQSR